MSADATGAGGPIGEGDGEDCACAHVSTAARNGSVPAEKGRAGNATTTASVEGGGAGEGNGGDGKAAVNADDEEGDAEADAERESANDNAEGVWSGESTS